jgi:hypothetical protein
MYFDILCQVLRDWTPVLSDSAPSAKKAKAEAVVREQTIEGLRAMLKDGLSAGKAKDLAKRADDIVHAEKQLRKSNRSFLQSLDNSLRHGAGFGIRYFKVDHVLHPMKAGEKRVFEDVEADVEEGMPRKRSYIENVAGVRNLELPRTYENGKCVRRTAHICSDLGSVGLAGSMWLLHGFKIRGTFVWELLHRLHCALIGATSRSGLTIIRLEFSKALKLRQGPFMPGGQNHGVLLESSREFWSMLDQNNPLFEALFELIADDFGDVGPEVGSAEHQEMLWKRCQSMMVDRGKGNNNKDGRWWSFETKSKRFMPEVHATLMVMMFIGFRRG